MNSLDIQHYIDTHFKKMKFRGSDVYVTNDENQYYVTHADDAMKDWIIQFCAEKQLTSLGSTCGPGSTICIGYSPVDDKWYGWSHRAYFGFGIGSSVKKGDVAYRAQDKQSYMDDTLRFWKDKDHLNIRIEDVTDQDFKVVWEYSDTIPNVGLRGQTTKMVEKFPKTFGRGEWVASTMNDAKQMAIDYANNIG